MDGESNNLITLPYIRITSLFCREKFSIMKVFMAGVLCHGNDTTIAMERFLITGLIFTWCMFGNFFIIDSIAIINFEKLL